MRFPSLFSALVVLTAAGCAPAPAPVSVVESPPAPLVEPEPELEGSALVACGTSRPQVCTMIYAPVCAHFGDGRLETQASGCNACADDTVVAYLDGPCTQAMAQ